MTELEKIEYTKSFIEKLANGINPMTGEPVPEGDLINNIRISRCFFYISGILREIIDNGGLKKKRTVPKKQPFSIGPNELSQFIYSQDPIPVSEITRRINELCPREDMIKLRYSSITGFLLQNRCLQEETGPDGKKVKRPTPDGNRLGIFLEERVGQYGIYHVTVYNEDAQRYILDHIDAVIEINAAPKAKRPDASLISDPPLQTTKDVKA